MATNGATKYLSAGMSAQQIAWMRDGVVLAILIPLVWRAGAVACAPDGLSSIESDTSTSATSHAPDAGLSSN